MPKPEAVTFKQLRALSAVASCGTMTAAAEMIGLTPPAVHTQLRQLEQHFGCKLLQRGRGGGTDLTLQGEAVLTAARKIEAALTACAERVAAQNEGREGLVNLGVVSTGKYFAPALVARLRRAYPEIEVLLKVGNRDSVLAWLEDATVDMAIMGRPPRLPQVVSTALGAHPHVLIAPPDHPLAGREELFAEDLVGETYIARERGSGTRVLMDRFLDRLGEERPYPAIELSSNETIKQAVIAGLGLALISRHTVTDELREGRLVELPVRGLPIVRQWYMVHRNDLPMDAASRNIHDFISELDGTFLPS